MKQKSKKHFWIYASLLALVFLCLSAHGGTMLNNNDNGAGSLHYGMANATTDKSHPDKDHDHDHDCPTTGVTNFWALGGNAGTKAGSNFLGTTDNQPLELKVNGQRALRFEPNTNGAPNILGGSPANRVGPNPNAVGVTIAGGGAMSVSPFDELFQGDFANVADSYFATIGGGFANKIQMNTPTNATSNRAIAATIAGGYSNTIAGQFAAIGGGSGNTVTANGGSAAIAGGYGNSVSGGASTIAGGTRNNMAGTLSSIGGGSANTVEFNSYSATIAGGSQNLIQTNAQAATIGGGQGNTIQSGPESNFASTIAGGGYNSIATGANYSSIGGGAQNSIQRYGGYSGDYSTIAGGSGNSVQAGAIGSAIGGGYGNTSTGPLSAIPGGDQNIANTSSFAAGHRAKASHTGAFVWADATDADVSSAADNQFTARASGGVVFYSTPDLSSGVSLAPGGGSWASLSDRNAKEHLQSVDGRAVLEKLCALPLATWNYKTQAKSIRHLGPMAQDFHAAFQIGEDDKHITTIDEDGVALAAIQGLNDKLNEKVMEIQQLKQRLEKLEQLVNEKNGDGK